MRLLKSVALNQPTVDSDGVNRGKFFGCGCWLSVVCSSMVVQQHYNGTLMSLPQHFKGQKNVSGVFSCISIEYHTSY